MIILIGGTSHVGKSSVARALAARLGWTARTTDHLARHPGRPWGNIPPHVPEHYRDLDVDALIESVMAHYERLWPAIADIVEKEDRLVLEGSALLPHNVAKLRVPAVVLTASNRLIEERMHRESGYDGVDSAARALIDKFLARTFRFNEIILEEAKTVGMQVIEVKDGASVEDVAGKGCDALLSIADINRLSSRASDALRSPSPRVVIPGEHRAHCARCEGSSERQRTSGPRCGRR